MERNTKWAIGLCTAVILVYGWFTINNQKKAREQALNNADQTNESQESTADAQNSNDGNSNSEGNNKTPAVVVKKALALGKDVSDVSFVFNTFVENEDESEAKEKFISVEFTNKGGDITGFELVQHKDKERPVYEQAEDQEPKVIGYNGVEMVKTASADENPAAFSIELSDNKITDNFNVSFSKSFYANIDDPEKKLESLVNKESKDEDPMSVTFAREFENEGKKFTMVKKYTFIPNEYMFKLDVSFENDAPASYTIKTAPQIGPKFNAKDRYDYRRVIYYNAEDNDEEENFGKEKKTITDDWDYIGLMGKYFEMVLLPESKTGKTASYEMVKTEDEKSASNIVSVTSSNASDSYYCYVGPRTESELSKYCNAADNGWGLKSRLDYSQPSSGFLSWLQALLKLMLEGLHYLIGNWGVDIIILTIILKVALFPLTKKSLMGNQKMQKIQPQLEAIKAKYKDNPQKMQAETAKLYKETGYNPVSGCLPLILQFLVLWSMYQLFYNYFEFRGSVFIPGWIDDLSRGDTVYTFEGSYMIIGSDLRILPIIYLVSQLLYGKITQNGGTATGSQMNMKMMMYGMPILFFVMFYSAPSGLLLYWTVSNIFQLFQQIFINKTMKNKAPETNDKKFKIAKNK